MTPSSVAGTQIIRIFGRSIPAEPRIAISAAVAADTGLAVIAAEPKELTFVHIDGTIDPDTLGKLGGQFGIPNVEMPPVSRPAEKTEPK